jgi:3-hydroxypropanoate dehydrogenase
MCENGEDEPMRVADMALDVLFRKARSQNGWQDTSVSESQLRRLYDLMKWGPTSANTSPARFIFVRSHEAKARLLTHLVSGNVEKTRTAPVTAIIGYDLHFYDKMPFLFPHDQAARSWFSGEDLEHHATETAFRNGTLQGAYLILAARALGLDCGPMSGFDAEGVDREFWRGTSVKTNFLCNLGCGDAAKLFPRHPRLTFDEVCMIQ